MFEFLKRKKKENKDSVDIASNVTIVGSTQASVDAATAKFAKPERYDRSVLDDGAAKRQTKISAFKKGDVFDPYTGEKLTLTKSEAKQQYGEDWTSHLAEADHKIALEKRYEQTKDNPWLTNGDIRQSSNSEDNLENVSRKFNNAKRSRSNKEFVSDDEYLERTGVKLTEEGKARAIESEEIAQAKLNKRDRRAAAKNIVETGHNAGMNAAYGAAQMTGTMSAISNIIDVVSGKKDAKTAIKDVAKDTAVSAGSAYAIGNVSTTLAHTLTGSSSKFIKALGEANVPAKVITAVVITGKTIASWTDGEITTTECLLQLGDKGVNTALMGTYMTAGQALIPIPVVGAAVGAMVGSILTSNVYNSLVADLRRRDYEHQERLRIIEECNQATKELRAYREQLESYLQSYFSEYQHCFDEALNNIAQAIRDGDTDGVIQGANIITRKLGGNVYYNNMEEFEEFLESDIVDVF